MHATANHDLEPITRSMALANGLGHVELSWDSKDDEKIRELIVAKKEEGIRFFLIETTSVVFRKKKLKNIEDLTRHRINVHDKDVHALLESKVVTMRPMTASLSEYHIIPGEPTPEEIVTGHSVAVKQLGGG